MVQVVYTMAETGVLYGAETGILKNTIKVKSWPNLYNLKRWIKIIMWPHDVDREIVILFILNAVHLIAKLKANNSWNEFGILSTK